MQDFNNAVAIKSAVPPSGFNYDPLLEFQEAIVLYMYGAPAAGEQACAQAAKVSPGLSSLITDLCDKMKRAGLAIGQLKPDTRSTISGGDLNSLTFHNPSELDVVIKLVGPSSQGFALPRGKSVSLTVPAGEYRILLRYTKSDKDYIYAKGGPLAIAQTSTAHSETKITLPVHPKSQSEAQKQFAQAQITVSDHPLSELPHPAGANAGFRFVRAITGSDEKVRSLSFSQDSRMLAVANFGSIKVWDVNSGTEVWHSSLNSGNYVAFSPDSKFLAYERDDGSHSVITLVEPAVDKYVSQLGRSKGNSSMSFNLDGRLLAFGSRDAIEVLDVSTSRVLYSITSKKDMIGSIAFSPDGHRLASGGKNGIILWDAADGKWLKTFGAGDFVAFSPDGQMIASASSQNITLWNLDTGQKIRSLGGKAPVVFSQDGRWLASRSADSHTVKIWNVTTGQEIATLGDPSDDLTSIAMSADGEWLAFANEYDTVWLWRRSSQRAQ